MPVIGQILQNRYRIDACLGQGGMGGVFKARHLELDSDVAIKVLTFMCDEMEERDRVLRLYRTEAQILSHLEHPGLPRVHDFFEIDGVYCIVMDLIDGVTLADLVSRSGPQSEATVRAWADDLCDVLDYLHHRTPPIVFKDLKPSNVMLAKDGRLRLIDFGIAKVLNQETSGGTQTIVRGAASPGFAAPEQYGSGSDPRADIYSLGATLYSLLSGAIPTDSAARASGFLELEPLQKYRPDVSPGLCSALHDMMALGRNQRPQTIAEVRVRLGLTTAPLASVDRNLTEIPMVPLAVTARPPVANESTAIKTPPPRPDRVAPRFRAWAIGLMLLLLVAGGLALNRRDDPIPPTVPRMATVTLRTTPSDAHVTVDGRQVTMGGQSLEVPPGSHIVEVSAPGYITQRQELQLAEGDRFSSEVVLRPMAARLELSVRPETALIRIDGRDYGVAGPPGRMVDLPPGNYLIQVSAAGHYQATERVSLGPGARYSIRLDLASIPVAPARPKVTAPPLAVTRPLPPAAPAPVPMPQATVMVPVSLATPPPTPSESATATRPAEPPPAAPPTQTNPPVADPAPQPNTPRFDPATQPPRSAPGAFPQAPAGPPPQAAIPPSPVAPVGPFPTTGPGPGGFPPAAPGGLPPGPAPGGFGGPRPGAPPGGFRR